jgi:hypothetical protein
MIRIKSGSTNSATFRAAILYPILLKPQEQFGPYYLRKNGQNKRLIYFWNLFLKSTHKKEMI